MLFEDIMLLILLGSGVFLIGIPCYKFVRAVLPQKRNPVVETKERLEAARLSVEAARMDVEIARLQKEKEKIYDDMYKEVLSEDDTETQNRRRI